MWDCFLQCQQALALQMALLSSCSKLDCARKYKERNRAFNLVLVHHRTFAQRYQHDAQSRTFDKRDRVAIAGEPLWLTLQLFELFFNCKESSGASSGRFLHLFRSLAA
jgi:hypothetical protein